MTNKIYNRFFTVETLKGTKSNYKLVKTYMLFGITVWTVEYFKGPNSKPFKGLLEAAYEYERLEEESKLRKKIFGLNLLLFLVFILVLLWALGYSPLDNYWLLDKR